MEWKKKARRAFVRAFSPMPPTIRREPMKEIARKIEKRAVTRGATRVEMEDIFIVSREALNKKASYMYGSLIEALKTEGFNIDKYEAS